jgi:uracil-DNA glycosylase
MTDLWTSTRGNHNARIMIVGESWGRNEAAAGKPFVGMSGQEQSRILAECGIDEADCFFTNVVNAQPPGEMMYFFELTKEATLDPVFGLYPEQIVREGLSILWEQINRIQPRLIIGYGNYVLWALTENDYIIKTKKGRKIPTGIGRFRGSQLHTRPFESGSFIPFLPTYHPAAALRNWPWRYLIKHDIKTRAPLHKNWERPRYHFQIEPSFSSVMSAFSAFRSRGGLLSTDVETRDGHIDCISFAQDKLNAICVPFTRHDGSAYWTEEDEFTIIMRLRKIFSNPKIQIIGQNFLYDAQYIHNEWFVKVKIYFDTMVLHHLCWPGDGKTGGIVEKHLGHLSSLYCEHHRYWKEDLKESNRNMDDRQRWVYNCEDAARTFEIALELEKIIHDLGLEEQAQIQMDTVDMALEMMLRGVRVDMDRKAQVSIDLAETIMEYEERFEEMVPLNLMPKIKKAAPWYRSSKQKRALFYDVLGMEVIKDRKTGAETVDGEALKKIGRREPILRKLCTMLVEYGSLCTFHGTFAKAKLDPDNQMRCSFNPAGTETFRWSSSQNAFGRGMNLQNIPKGSEEDD